jgi:uncharacterized damage-inducible protein DinB
MIGMTEGSRPEPPWHGDEISTLRGFLDYQRATLAWKCSGLSDAQLRVRLPSSELSLGGLLKHMARVEDGWFSEVVADGPPVPPWRDLPWAQEWTTDAADTGDELRRLWQERVRASDAVLDTAMAAGPAALATPHAAWGGQGDPSLRWVLVHMIEEYARHNGHADLLRESIDGEVGE